MAKKADILAQAQSMGLEVTAKNTIAQIEEAINQADPQPNKAEVAPVEVEAETETATEENSDEAKEEEKFAKAGKRSAKAQLETDAKLEKEARKEAGDTTAQDPEAESAIKRGPTPVTRPKLERRGKKYQAAAKLVEKDKLYPLAEALELATKTSPSKFDASVEFHVRLGVDPRQSDQNIRATVSLPNGTGKTIRVAVLAPEGDHTAAKKAGADIVGEADFLKQLDKELIDFDVLVATPQLMPKLGKYARLLGPRGLMPNPKAGTVATDVAKAVTEAKAGKVEYRVDKQAVIHLAFGKVSFGAEKLRQNADVFLNSLEAQKPTGLKGTYVKSLTLTTTMGPGIRVENTIA